MRDQKLEEEDARVEIWSYVFGFTKMAVVKCAIELGIPDAIHNSTPIPLGQLSSTLGCDPPSLSRIMRFLVHHRIFKETPLKEEDGSGTTVGYVHTPLSRCLIRQREGDMKSSSLADFILFESNHVMLKPWLYLSPRVRAGIACPAFEQAHGEDVWKYAKENLEFSGFIDVAMACNARLAVPAIVQGCCPSLFDGVKTLVDVGGGNGTSIRLFVEACPSIQGINFDLPHVVSMAPQIEGVTHVGGDMFQSVPKADAAFLMQVLHDWNDEDCVRILTNCREAIAVKGKGKVIIAEAVVEEEKEGELEYARLMLDMVMMAHTNSGKERNLKEWEYILNQSGFSRVTVTRIKAVQSIIQAFP
ncbi:Acetylserotonin O-methyltransferase [Linum grandiflorum]